MHTEEPSQRGLCRGILKYRESREFGQLLCSPEHVFYSLLCKISQDFPWHLTRLSQGQGTTILNLECAPWSTSGVCLRVLNQESKYFQWVFKALSNLGEMWWYHSEVPTIYNVIVVSFCLVHGCTKIQMMNANPQSPVPLVIPHMLFPSPTSHESAYVTADEFSFPAYVDCNRMCSIIEVVCPSVVHSECSHMSLKVGNKMRSTSLGHFVVHIRKCHLHKPIAVTLLKGAILCNPHILPFVVDQSTELQMASSSPRSG